MNRLESTLKLVITGVPVESIDQVWLFVAIALAAGVVLGAILHKVFSSSAGDVDKLKVELEQTRSEMERYKASVNSHFSKTSDLVSELTQDYVKVYQHLAEGAQALSDSPEFTQMLEQSEGKVLISVEDDTPGPETVVVEPETVVAESEAVVADSEAVVVEPLADASESVPADDAIPRGEDDEDRQHSDRPAPVNLGDDLNVAEEDRKDPVIGDSAEDADNEATITPVAQKEDVAPEDSAADAVRKT